MKQPKGKHGCFGTTRKVMAMRRSTPVGGDWDGEVRLYRLTEPLSGYKDVVVQAHGAGKTLLVDFHGWRGAEQSVELSISRRITIRDWNEARKGKPGECPDPFAIALMHSGYLERDARGGVPA